MEVEEYVWLGPYAAAVTLILAVVSVFVWMGVRFDRNQQKKAVEGVKDEVCYN